MGWAFSAKRCKRTLKAAPALWILGFVAEHAIALWVSHSSMAESQSEKLLIQRTEYVTFFLSIFLVAALVLVCTAAALGIDEDRHVKHLKYK
jgi:ABC-type polysaccharide transport system permease subunit